jgi:hypothetical protein
MRSPNLFIVGAMKSGSTTLHDYLAEHPEIFMSPDKEPGFFVPQQWKNRKPEEYDRLFAAADREKYIGESSTYYSKLPTYPGVARRIHQYNADSRIVYIVRDPIQRTISHYLHNRRDLQRHAENRPILKAIEQDESYIAYSNYAMQLQPYYEVFGRERILVVLFEEMVASPEATLRGVFQWLDVDTDFTVATKRKSNAAPAIAPAIRGFGILNRVRYSSYWDRLSPLIPKRIKNFGNILAQKIETVNVSAREAEEVRQKLRPLYQDYVRDLEALTGRNCSWRL